MIVGGRTQMMDSYDVPDALERMKTLGFDGAEVCVENLKFDIRPELMDAKVLEEAGAALRSLGFRAWSYSYHADYITNDEVLARTIRTIELTRHLGTNVFVFSGRRRSKLDDPVAAWKTLVARTRLLADAAEANDVLLALETEPGFVCGTTEELLRLMDEVDSRTLCANMDIGHSFLCDPDPLAAIAALGDRIVHAHVDNMRRGVHDHLLPDTGDMDLSAYLRALRDAGFRGVGALDLYGYPYESIAAEAVAYVRSIAPAE